MGPGLVWPGLSICACYLPFSFIRAYQRQSAKCGEAAHPMTIVLICKANRARGGGAEEEEEEEDEEEDEGVWIRCRSAKPAMLLPPTTDHPHPAAITDDPKSSCVCTV